MSAALLVPAYTNAMDFSLTVSAGETDTSIKSEVVDGLYRGVEQQSLLGNLSLNTRASLGRFGFVTGTITQSRISDQSRFRDAQGIESTFESTPSDSMDIWVGLGAEIPSATGVVVLEVATSTLECREYCSHWESVSFRADYREPVASGVVVGSSLGVNVNQPRDQRGFLESRHSVPFCGFSFDIGAGSVSSALNVSALFSNDTPTNSREPETVYSAALSISVRLTNTESVSVGASKDSTGLQMISLGLSDQF